MNSSRILSTSFLILFLTFGTSFSQERYGQVEISGGMGLPMAPDEFKDYYKSGYCFKGQYVTFLNPSMGLSFGVGYNYFGVNKEKFEDEIADELAYYMDYYDMDADFDKLDIEGNINNLELSVGIRPYLSRPEANNQFYIFGEATYNIMKAEMKTEYGATVYEYDPYSGIYYETTSEGSIEMDADDEKFGLSTGIGIELPFGGGQSKIMIKGTYGIVFFSEDDGEISNENINFINISAGIAF